MKTYVDKYGLCVNILFQMENFFAVGPTLFIPANVLIFEYAMADVNKFVLNVLSVVSICGGAYNSCLKLGM